MQELKVIRKVGKTLPEPKTGMGRAPKPPEETKYGKLHAQLPKDGSWALIAEGLSEKEATGYVRLRSYAKRSGVKFAKRGGDVYARRAEAVK